MKKFLLHHYWLMAFVLAILPTAMVAQVSHVCNFSPITPQYADTVVDGLYYRTITLDDMETTTVPGAPLLPCRILQFSVPYNATDVTVTSVCHNSTTSSLNKLTLLPAPYPRAICDTTPEQVIRDSVIYYTNSYYPADMAEITGEGFMMGENHIVTVAVYPMQFNPVTGTLKTNPTVSFTISYTLSNSHTNNVVVRNDQSLRQQGWEETKERVVNANQVEAFAATGNAAHHAVPYLPDSLEYPISVATWEYGGELYTPTSEYMIVTTRNLAHSFRRLAALKRQKGYTVAVRCIEDIVNDPLVQFGDRVQKKDGTYSCINDSAGKLRHYLRLAYMMDNTRFVLFGGKQVPFRYGYLQDTVSVPQVIINENIPTDLYYSDLTTNWNLDDDNYYGERDLFRQSYLDVSPELYVGRLMAENDSHMRNYTDKLLRYELNPGRGSGDYLNRVLITDGMTDSAFDGVTQYLSDSYSTLFPNVNLIPITSNPTGTTIIDNISENHYGIVNIFGHGCPNNITVNQGTKSLVWNFDYRKQKPYDKGLDMLNNKYFPFIMYSESCDNIPFDIYQNLSKGWVFNIHNLGQSFTLGKNYGGVAYLGNTRSGYASVSNGNSVNQPRLEQFFIKELTNGVTKIGIAEAVSKAEFCKIRKYSSLYVMPHNLMGEPEFEIWTDEPLQFNGISVIRSDNSITVSGVNPDSATVAICGNYTYPQRMKAINGTAIFNNVSPNSMVMVHKHNYLPYIAPLYVQNDTLIHSQYVIASDAYLGRNVDSNRTAGDVVIPSGVSYEMEFTGEAILGSGFEVQKGASLTVVPSDY